MKRVIILVAIFCVIFYLAQPSKPQEMGLLGKLGGQPSACAPSGLRFPRSMRAFPIRQAPPHRPRAGGFSSKPAGENDERVNKAVDVAKQEVRLAAHDGVL